MAPHDPPDKALILGAGAGHGLFEHLGIPIDTLAVNLKVLDEEEKGVSHVTREFGLDHGGERSAVLRGVELRNSAEMGVRALLQDAADADFVLKERR